MHYFFYPEVGSTNDVAKTLFHRGVAMPFCVVSERQTAGRGQYGRAWVADEGGLYLSLVMVPQFFTDDCVYRSAFLVGQVIHQVTGLSATIKRPNDVMLMGKKVAGILLELGWSAGDSAPVYGIIGVGLNVNQARFPEAISDRAISLCQIVGERCSKDVFIQILAKELGHVFARN